MADFIPELLTLKEILFEKKSFQEAYFKTKLNERISNCENKRLKERISGCLRHYQSLSFECLNALPVYDRNSEEFLLSLIALYLLRYEKNDETDVKVSYHDSFVKMRMLGDANKNFEALLSSSKNVFTIPDDVKDSPFVYNSMILETPEFLLKRWCKDFSADKSGKIALSLHYKPSNYYYKTREDVSLVDYNLQPVNFDKGIVIYKAKKGMSSAQARELSLIQIDYIEAYAFSKIELPHISPSILLNGPRNGSSFLLYSLNVNHLYQNKVVAAYQSLASFRSASDLEKKYQLKGTSFLFAESSLIKTYLPFDSFDFAVCYGKDAGIGMARRKIEVLPSLKEKDLAVASKSEYDQLLDSAEFIKKNGTLLFLSSALDKEEGSNVIKKFLSNRKDYALVDQEYLLPCDNDIDGGYYAILRRIK